MTHACTARLDAEIKPFTEAGVYRKLNHLESPQAPWVQMEGRGRVLVLSSNNYLGLSAEPAVVEAGRAGLEKYRAGAAAGRVICGTLSIHRQPEQGIAPLPGARTGLTYGSCSETQTRPKP